MKSKLKLVGLAFVLFFIVAACKEDDPVANNDIAGLHLVGERFDGTTSRASYWKDGVQSYMTVTGKSGSASSIKIKDNDIYIAYSDYTNYPYQLHIWKNTAFDKIIDDGTSAQGSAYYGDIEFFGNNQYVLTAYNKACRVFKNGTPGDVLDINPNDLFVAGDNEYYVVGTKNDKTDPNNPVVYAALWANGTTVTVVPSDPNGYSHASSVIKKDGKLYVSGKITKAGKEEAFVWQDGVITKLPAGEGSSSATQIYINGSDVYVSGWSTEAVGGIPHATYWKNGVKVVLESAKRSEIYKLLVSKSGDVYAIGYVGDDYKGALWVNGVLDSKFNGSQTDDEFFYDMLLVEK